MARRSDRTARYDRRPGFSSGTSRSVSAAGGHRFFRATAWEWWRRQPGDGSPPRAALCRPTLTRSPEFPPQFADRTLQVGRRGCTGGWPPTGKRPARWHRSKLRGRYNLLTSRHERPQMEPRELAKPVRAAAPAALVLFRSCSRDDEPLLLPLLHLR